MAKYKPTVRKNGKKRKRRMRGPSPGSKGNGATHPYSGKATSMRETRRIRKAMKKRGRK
jgi:hypothetical protein